MSLDNDRFLLMKLQIPESWRLLILKDKDYNANIQYKLSWQNVLNNLSKTKRNNTNTIWYASWLTMTSWSMDTVNNRFLFIKLQIPESWRLLILKTKDYNANIQALMKNCFKQFNKIYETQH